MINTKVDICGFRGTKNQNSSQSTDYQLHIQKLEAEIIELRQENQKFKAVEEAFRLSEEKFDITELRRYQQQMARLDCLNLVGEMAAGFGHEIRNPMTTVRGFLQLLGGKERYAQDKEIMDIMIEELDRANAIITEYLTLAKNKKVELKKQSLNQKVKDILPLLQADALKQDKSIEVQLGDIPYLVIDCNEIKQLLLNLVRNGLEAMQSGGVLSIKTCWEDDGVSLLVQDQGPGIPAEVLKKLGTPFFTTKDNGIGLGLAICYNIAQRHQAKIDIATGAGGTIFCVRFKA